MEYVKDPHTTIFSGSTSCGKTRRVLDLVENEYRLHFENIVILCPTLNCNDTYQERSWVWKDDYVFCIEPKDHLFDWIERLSKMRVGK